MEETLQGCRSTVVFAVASCVPWCGILRSKEVLLPGFDADNLMCVGP